MSLPSSGQRSALVLYGSETGNAQDVAEEMGRMVQRLHFSVVTSALDSVQPATLSRYGIVLIAISTTGQGELPSNSRRFWSRLLVRRLPPNYLANVNFGVFGLGDSSYPQFNWAALKLFKRMVQLGAQAISAKGEGDEQHPEGIDSIFLPWLQKLRSELLVEFPLDAGILPIPDDELLQPQWLLAKLDDYSSLLSNTHTRPSSRNSRAASNKDLQVSLVANTRVTSPNHWQDVRHLTFKADTATDYSPGDVLTVYPQNPSEDVDQILSLMEWTSEADTPLTFSHNSQYPTTVLSPPPVLPAPTSPSTPLTLRVLLTSYLDLNAIPRRSFFALILHFTTDTFQKARLQEFADPELTDELFDYTTRPRRSILEVLQEFVAVKIPWQWAAVVLPPLRGRQFSIASGGAKKAHPDDGTATFELLVAIVKYKTVIRKIRQGVCTRYLEGLPTGARLDVTLVRGSLGISKADAQRPVVMIGPGTGVAPMRSLAWERASWAQGPERSQKSLGQGLLFFGCRSASADYFFQDEWRSLAAQPPPAPPFHISTAFSRDQARKVYVQDVVRERHELVFKLLWHEGGIVYICGSSGKMPAAVREALVEVVQKGAGVEREEAEKWLKGMEREGRYLQETW